MTRAESAHCRLAAALLLGATACVPIPHKHAEEPSAEFLVTDQQRRPLAGARITIYRGSGIGHDSMKPQLTLTTDTAGTVRVRGRERWHFVFVAIPDAEAGHRWAWCVEASGFQPLTRPLGGGGRIFAPLVSATTAERCPSSLR